VEFRNEYSVHLDSLISLPPGVIFNNLGGVMLTSIIGIGGWFEKWSGNIKGIDNKRLLNVMISKGVFEK